MTIDPNSKIGRWVAFLILPLATALATIVSVKAKAWFGIDVNKTEAAAFIGSVALGIITWLFNRGKIEAAHVLKKDPLDVDKVVAVLQERLPLPPQAPAPGDGSPASPRAPGPGAGMATPPH